MRFASLGSGSRGNALVVEAAGTRVLLDCGFSVRETTARLARLGLAPEQLSALVVTHEHGDHVGGIGRLARRHDLPVYLTHGTRAALREPPPRCVVIDSHAPFAIGDLRLTPFPVPHDAREPVQYTFDDGARRLGVLTDAGSVTPCIVDALTGCDGLVLECNHDPALLAASSYPAALKARVGGRFGHLDNGSAAALLGRLDTRRLQHLVAAHLSEQNNRPELAVAALAGVLGCPPAWVGVADQALGFDWRALA